MARYCERPCGSCPIPGLSPKEQAPAKEETNHIVGSLGWAGINALTDSQLTARVNFMREHAAERTTAAGVPLSEQAKTAAIEASQIIASGKCGSI